MIDPHELSRVYQATRGDLLAERVEAGHWVGQLSSSPLSTATAVSALSIVADKTDEVTRRERCRALADRAIDWLGQQQNDDGGFGDTDKSFSNISTTMLVRAAVHLAGAAERCGEMLRRAEAYIEAAGGIEAIRQRYGTDKTFAVPILTNAALAGLVPWREVSPLPFELACLPFGLLRLLRLPVVSYAVPALVAVGQARFFHRRPRNPLQWLIRRMAVGKSLKVLERMQPATGGFLEAVPLTSFVAMSLAATGRADHAVTRRAVNFLIESVRDDGSWPIDANLATWTTSLSVNALAAATGTVGALRCLDWLLSCQHHEVHPFTQTPPGGWGWSDLSGAVPDADDTAGALLALRSLRDSGTARHHPRIDSAASDGIRWLLDLQNADGGWPTFCRGWGTMAFDRSGTDLTAHAIRALRVWEELILDDRIAPAIVRGFDYLGRTQRPDGSWIPLWFGNQHRAGDENPVYGTARVLLAYRDFGRIDTPPSRRGLDFLVANQLPDGGWGSSPKADSPPNSSIEETAAAVEALLAAPDNPAWQPALEKGLQRLVSAVHENRWRETSPVGLYFAKLWYYEKLYPLIFTVSALGHAVHRFCSGAPPQPVNANHGRQETTG